MSTTFFTSQRNSMKRDPSSGSSNMAAPVTSAYSGYLFTTTKVISHNLGYPPTFRIAYEPFGDGIIWPMLTNRFQQTAQNPLNPVVNGPGVTAWIDSTAPYNLNIQLFYKDATLTGTYPVYYVIYQDFAL